MASERSRLLRIVQEAAVDYRLVPKTAAYQMTPLDNLVKTDSTAVLVAITLPPVVECAGGQYFVKQVAGAMTTTVVDKGDSTVAIAATLSTTTAAVLFTSDGERWYALNTYA